MPGDAVVSCTIPQTGLPSPTLRDLLAVMFRQRRLAVILFSAFLALGLAYWIFTPAYQAQMKILPAAAAPIRS